MKKIIIFVLSAIFSMSIYAEDLSQGALQGSWLVVEYQNEPDTDKTIWEFGDDSYIQHLGNSKLRPEKYKVAGNEINMEYYSIEVTHFDGKTMEATLGGAKYKLVKQQ